MRFLTSTAMILALGATSAMAQSNSEDSTDMETDGQAVAESGENSTEMNADSETQTADSEGESGMTTDEDSDMAESDGEDANMNEGDTETADSSMQNDGGMDREYTREDFANFIRSRDITGGNIYTNNQADDEGWDPEMNYDSVDANWNQIGEIEDIVLDKSGKMIGIIAEVGGFLDIGDKHVMLPVENVSLVAVDDATYGYVTNKSEEELEEMESVDEGFWN